MKCVQCENAFKEQELVVTSQGYLCDTCKSIDLSVAVGEKKQMIGVVDRESHQPIRKLIMKNAAGKQYTQETDLTDEQLLSSPSRIGHEIVREHSYRSNQREALD